MAPEVPQEAQRRQHWAHVDSPTQASCRSLSLFGLLRSDEGLAALMAGSLYQGRLSALSCLQEVPKLLIMAVRGLWGGNPQGNQ